MREGPRQGLGGTRTSSSPFVHPVGEVRQNNLCLLVEKCGVLGHCSLLRVGIHVFLFVTFLGVARARGHAYSNGANGPHVYSSCAECFVGGKGEGVGVLASGGLG